MSYLARYTQRQTCAAQSSSCWSTHVDALERHLSVNTWALKAAAIALITYPIARIVIPVLESVVLPDVLRTVLNCW